MNEKNKELIIVGNGIDLSAGLKSSYGDFFNNRIEVTRLLSSLNKKLTYDEGKIDWHRDLEEDETLKILKHAIYFYNLSFWDLPEISERYVNLNWEGIENDIKNTLLKYFDKNGSLYKEVPCFFREIKNNKEEINYCSKSLLLLYLIEEIKRPENISNIKTYKLDDDKYVRNLISQFMYNQLIDFENTFKEYLSIQANNADYIENSKLLYNELVSKNRASVVLSFNYTNPLGIGITDDTNSREKYNIDNYYHVHGSLNGEIIFGIDDNYIERDTSIREKNNNYTEKDTSIPKKNNNNTEKDTSIREKNDNYIEKDTNITEINKFTKTYRIMREDNDLNIDIYDGIDVIKFYGHSLSKADNSYFQSIFDYCDIYNNMITLEFYYSNYGDEDREGETKDLVYDLIERYGNTLDNKNKGKNLLHKMNIEGRIKVRELKTSIK